MVNKEYIEGYVKALQDFGYRVTEEWVQKEADALAAGKKPEGGPSGFIDGWLKEHGFKSA